ncbi:LapA family protein [Alicyclobacillus curvatus]|jgi:lipopolysaccharide assembly protein A|nr:LapA family protein [Alicyclobacillus curvatus]
MRWKVLLIALFALLIAWFTLDNATTVSVRFLLVSAKTSLVFVILISVLLGMSLMAVLWSARAWKMRRVAKNLKQQVTALENELQAARKELSGVHQPVDEQTEQMEHPNPEPASAKTEGQNTRTDSAQKSKIDMTE